MPPVNTAITELRAKLSAGKTNPLYLYLLRQLDFLLLLVAGQTPEAQKEIVKDFCKTILIWLPYAQKWAVGTPSDLDDVLVEEIEQFCNGFLAS